MKYGFAPVYDSESKVLILGSFPSVKSREVCFYYGNKQNRFWKTLCSYFGDEIPESVEGKREYVIRRNVALWDVVSECEIEGSQDNKIKNFKVADINSLLQNSKVRYIIINGSKAYTIFEKYFSSVGVPVEKLSSTSPANVRFSLKEWHDALSRAFGRA